MPLPDMTGAVAGCRQQLGQRRLIEPTLRIEPAQVRAYWPLKTVPRAGEHTGLLVTPTSNRKPSAASRSMFGVCTTGWP